MALSSPGQTRVFDPMDQMPMMGSLSDTADDAVHRGEEAMVLLDEEEAFLSTQPSPNLGQSRQGVSEKDTASYGPSKDTMLLEKPSTLSRALDLDKGYEFGPAVQFAPGFFTKIPGKQAPLHPSGQPQEPVNNPSLRSNGVSHSHGLSPDSRPIEKADSSQPQPAEPSIQTLPQALTTGPRFGGSGKNKANGTGTIVLKHVPSVAGKPPFPDTSPKKPATPSVQGGVERKSVPASSAGETRAQIPNPNPVMTNSLGLGQESCTSAQTAQVRDEAILHHSPSGRGGQLPLKTAGVEEAGRWHQHSPVPPTGSSRYSTREPADRARRHMVNRPVREVVHSRPARSVHCARPESRSSNVSKQRSRCGSLTSSPIVRQRRVNISHEFTTGMAGIINQFTHQQNAALEEQKEKYHKYIKRLKKDLFQESGVVARQLSEIDAQSKAMEALQASKEHLASQLHDIEAKLRVSDDRSRRLEEKYHACKTHLNSAIQEQQDLYTRSKEQWDETLRQVRAMGKSQSVEAEMAVQKAEVVREEMTEKVRQAIAQNKSEALELHGRIEALTHQVEEKEAELRQERESVGALSKQLQDLQTTSTGFEALASQSKQILDTIGEQQSKADAQRQKLAEELRHRLDAIVDRLEQLSGVMSVQPDALTSIREGHDESARVITAKLDTILESRDAITEATGQLSADLELHTEKIWKRLDDQLESLSKQLAEKAEENGMVSALYKRKDAECERHKRAIESLRETTEKQCDQIRDLEANLVSLDAAQEENEDTIRRLEATARDTAQLKEDLKAKAAVVAELQNKLDVKEKEHASELQSYSSNIHKLAQAIHEKDQSLGAAVQQAAETARREARAEMERAVSNTERLLQETQQQRDSLVGELENLKHQAHQNEQDASQHATKIRSLRETLATEEAKRRDVAEQLTQRTANIEELESRLTLKVNSLETKLNTARNQAVELKAENERQQTRSEAFLAGLKHWALQEGLAVDGFDCLSNGKIGAEELGSELTKILKQLSLSRKPQTVVPEANPKETLLFGENSKFLPGNQPQADPERQSTVAKPENDFVITALSELGRKNWKTEEGGSRGDPLPYAATLHHMRRVVVRSPANVPSEPAAPSIDQEKMRRREPLQPKSILKRITRSTSKLMKQEDFSVAGQGAFKRSRQNGPDGKPTDVGVSMASDANHIMSTTRASSRSSKRRRSETAEPDNQIGAFGSSRDETLREPSGLGTTKTHKEAQETKDSISGTMQIMQQGAVEAHPQQQHSARRGSLGIQPAADRTSRRNSGSGHHGLHSTPSANNPQSVGPRQLNVRTYGSQRVPAELSVPNRTSLSRPFSRSQSQSRYWSRPEDESQESMTFSQGVGADENLLLPFQA